ncbi:isocitrate lyase/phosphoenolpyruvate mutase family protein [Bordetella genomosp. 12]|uniref:Isocitrate lyase/phosphoenolpyruvate mutase family protein n=1 Tax=Bordetella genomosp. 12 TaxID=463035 RepID=A0A261VCC0_9BORD|nr:isocitrate lyase/phosphoenolpyruvate mutase family protein [Bordetella genomosp. 12]OZI71665.1 hypothetical protein CAL22_17855 [Bordetella genomosp. 12]
MPRNDLADKAAQLHQLHRSLFVMPTVWDAMSALAALAAGHRAVATSSAALGQALGIKASERVTFEMLEAQIRIIAGAVPVPLVIDLEDGYPEVAGGVGQAIARIIAAGAAGANIEDSRAGHHRPLADAEDHARRIEAARRAADAHLPGFFLNGRTDLFLQHPGVEPEVSVREAIRRARLYVEAGADGIYVAAGNLSEEQIAELVAGIPRPLTLVAREGLDLRRWRELGVSRASLGTLLIREAYAAIRDKLLRIEADQGIAQAQAVDLDAAIESGRAPAGAA